MPALKANPAFAGIADMLLLTEGNLSKERASRCFEDYEKAQKRLMDYMRDPATYVEHQVRDAYYSKFWADNAERRWELLDEMRENELAAEAKADAADQKAEPKAKAAAAGNKTKKAPPKKK